MAQNFIKKVEDFTCEHCGEVVKGDGYTNHCPKCLWSKHVDVNPGDRAENCQGMMSPVGYVFTGGQVSLMHRCESCGVTRKNRVGKNDDVARLTELC